MEHYGVLSFMKNNNDGGGRGDENNGGHRWSSTRIDVRTNLETSLEIDLVTTKDIWNRAYAIVRKNTIAGILK